MIPVTDLSRVGEARRAAEAIARRCGLDEPARGAVALIVTEAATNLARHARDGVMLLNDTSASGLAGLEMLAVDAGPGMNDLTRFFADGYSTGGSAGAGLGAMKRQAHELDVYSVPGQGTVVMARVFAREPHRDDERPALLNVGAVCVALQGETASGDGWCVHQERDRAVILLADGLGHGPNAAEAADAAIAAFRGITDRTPVEIVKALHETLRATRGAAISVAEVQRDTERNSAEVRVCAVGNTVTALVGPAATTNALPSMNGTAGLQVSALREFVQPWEAGAMLVMHTDGITTRWRADSYPGVLQHDPAVLAAVLHRDASRKRDDATVLAFTLRPRRTA